MRVALSRDGVLGTEVAIVLAGVRGTLGYAVWHANHHEVSMPAADPPSATATPTATNVTRASVATLEIDELQVVTS
jgi:hypothetical protein